MIFLYIFENWYYLNWIAKIQKKPNIGELQITPGLGNYCKKNAPRHQFLAEFKHACKWPLPGTEHWLIGGLSLIPESNDQYEPKTKTNSWFRRSRRRCNNFVCFRIKFLPGFRGKFITHLSTLLNNWLCQAPSWPAPEFGWACTSLIRIYRTSTR